VALDHRKLYWADLGLDEIRSSGISPGGSASTVVDTVDGDNFGVVVDTVNDKIYYTDQVNDTISSANRDGTDVTTLASGADGVTRALGIGIHRPNQKLYVVDFTTSELFSLDTDGGNFQVIASGADGISTPVGCAVDEINDKVYWTDSTDDNIRIADLDGSNISEIVTTENNIQGIAVYPEQGKIYWVTNSSPVALRRANLDGSSKETVTTISSGRGVTIDKHNKKVIWTEDGQDRIRQCNFDGSSIETIANLQAASTIRDIDIDQIYSMDLFIKGPMVSGDFPLFIMASSVFGDITLFTEAPTPISSGDIDLYVAGSPSGGIDLFEQGFDISSNSGDLYVSGPEQISGGFDLFIANSGVSGTWPIFLMGLNNDVSGEINLLIHGTTTSGVSVSSNEFDLFVQNSGEDVQDPPQFTGSFPAYLKAGGVGAESGYWSAFLKAKAESQNSLDLFIGSGPNVSGEISLFIQQELGFDVTPGFEGIRDDWSVFVKVPSGSSSEVDLFISGVPLSGTPNSGDIDFVTIGHLLPSGDIDMFMFGISGVGSGSFDLFIVAETGVIDSRPILYIHGF
jgi:hypothetical protein